MWLFLSRHLFFFFSLCYITIIVITIIIAILMVKLLLRVCIKAQKGVWSLPSAPRRQALSPWNVLPDESVFVHLGPWDMKDSLTM